DRPTCNFLHRALRNCAACAMFTVRCPGQMLKRLGETCKNFHPCRCPRGLPGARARRALCGAETASAGSSHLRSSVSSRSLETSVVEQALPCRRLIKAAGDDAKE